MLSLGLESNFQVVRQNDQYVIQFSLDLPDERKKRKQEISKLCYWLIVGAMARDIRQTITKHGPNFDELCKTYNQNSTIFQEVLG